MDRPVILDQDDRSGEFLMGAVQQAGIIGLGEGLAPVLAVAAVHMRPVDQACPPAGAGPGGDERSNRDAPADLVAPAVEGLLVAGYVADRDWRASWPIASA